MNSFHFRGGGSIMLPALYTLPIYDFETGPEGPELEV